MERRVSLLSLLLLLQLCSYTDSQLPCTLSDDFHPSHTCGTSTLRNLHHITNVATPTSQVTITPEVPPIHRSSTPVLAGTLAVSGILACFFITVLVVTAIMFYRRHKNRIKRKRRDDAIAYNNPVYTLGMSSTSAMDDTDSQAVGRVYENPKPSTVSAVQNFNYAKFEIATEERVRAVAVEPMNNPVYSPTVCQEEAKDKSITVDFISNPIYSPTCCNTTEVEAASVNEAHMQITSECDNVRPAEHPCSETELPQSDTPTPHKYYEIDVGYCVYTTPLQIPQGPQKTKTPHEYYELTVSPAPSCFSIASSKAAMLETSQDSQNNSTYAAIMSQEIPQARPPVAELSHEYQQIAFPYAVPITSSSRAASPIPPGAGKHYTAPADATTTSGTSDKHSHFNCKFHAKLDERSGPTAEPSCDCTLKHSNDHTLSCHLQGSTGTRSHEGKTNRTNTDPSVLRLEQQNKARPLHKRNHSSRIHSQGEGLEGGSACLCKDEGVINHSTCGQQKEQCLIEDRTLKAVRKGKHSLLEESHTHKSRQNKRKEKEEEKEKKEEDSEHYTAHTTRQAVNHVEYSPPGVTDMVAKETTNGEKSISATANGSTDFSITHK